MKSVPPFVVLEKSVGETPLQALEKWRAKHPEAKGLPATYAGRLDPMASGKLIILLGDECKKLENYTGLDKEYEIEVVFGIGTDTRDALGMPDVKYTKLPILHSTLEHAFEQVQGSHTVPYPVYSSKTVNGIPLFQYALEGKLNTISLPTHTETIYSLNAIGYERITGKELHDRIKKHLTHVPRSDESSKQLGADFRQDTIRTSWDEQLGKYLDKEFVVVRLKVVATSGTYMRTLAERLGKELGIRAFALSIHRSKIGRYKKFGPFGYWTNTF